MKRKRYSIRDLLYREGRWGYGWSDYRAILRVVFKRILEVKEYGGYFMIRHTGKKGDYLEISKVCDYREVEKK